MKRVVQGLQKKEEEVKVPIDVGGEHTASLRGRRPRSPSQPPPGFTGQTILVPARPVYRGPPDSPEYRPYEGAKNNGKKKVETQRYFKDYVAERRAEKRQAREDRERYR